MGQKYSSNRIYIWTVTRFNCKDPEFVQIICFDNALQESYWPLASDLHWSYELMPKRYCSKTADFFSCQSTLQLQRDWCWWHFFFFQFPWIHLNLFHKLHLEEALSQHNGKIATVVISGKLTYYFCHSSSFRNCACLTSLCDWLTFIIS